MTNVLANLPCNTLNKLGDLLVEHFNEAAIRFVEESDGSQYAVVAFYGETFTDIGFRVDLYRNDALHRIVAIAEALHAGDIHLAYDCMA